VILGKAPDRARPVPWQALTSYLVVLLEEGTLRGARLCIAMGCLAILLGGVETVGRIVRGGVRLASVMNRGIPSSA